MFYYKNIFLPRKKKLDIFNECELYFYDVYKYKIV